MDLQEWISELESTKSISNLGIGNPNSITRIFLLGFTYKQFGDKTQAEVYLTKAMGLMEENNKKLAQFSKDFPPDALIFLQLEIIKNAVANMQKQST